MSARYDELCMMFSGGTDTTLAAAQLLEENRVGRLHLLTFCNGICVKVERSGIHAGELKKLFGADRVHHEIIYVTEIFHELRAPLFETMKKYGSSLVFDLCCRLSMETAAIRYALDKGIPAVCDGTNIDQGRLFLEKPEYLKMSREFYSSFGVEYFSPVYDRSGGRMSRRAELVRRGFSVGPPVLEKLNISCCLFQQPFCLMAFHTFFFTSFLRKWPVLGGIIQRFNLPLDRALELRFDRQQRARRLLEEHRAFRNGAGAAEDFTLTERVCTTTLCGRNTVEMTFPGGTMIDLDGLASAWAPLTRVERDGDSLKLKVDRVDIVVFEGGTILFEGTKNREKALELYRRLVEKAFPDKAGLLKTVTA